LIEDVPGVGKTSIVSSLAKSVNASFKRIQFTPDILPSDITGFTMYNQKEGKFEYHPGSIMSQIILADEINRTSPKTQASLLEAMEEKQVTVDGVTYNLPRPFMVLATQNPVEYLGTYPLPEAQLDRFFMKVSIGYPEKFEESEILSRFHDENPLETLKPVADSSDILNIQSEVKKVYVDRSINNYIVDIVSRTRFHSEISLGSSPRAVSVRMHNTAGHCPLQSLSTLLPLYPNNYLYLLCNLPNLPYNPTAKYTPSLQAKYYNRSNIFLALLSSLYSLTSNQISLKLYFFQNSSSVNVL